LVGACVIIFAKGHHMKTKIAIPFLSYSINALGEVVGTYGDVGVGSSGSFYFLTCKK
jgi:hypothetical protein